MKTTALKLISGEELIGRLTGETVSYISMSHARTIGLQQANARGDVGIGMMDYILSNKDAEINISRAAVICQFDMAPEVERAYLSNTSGIQLS